MQHWKTKFAQVKVRFIAVVIAIVLLFSSLFVQPAMVRLFGTPLMLTYQAEFINPGSDVFGSLTIGEIPASELPLSIQNIYQMDDFDEAALLLREASFYITFKHIDGITVRDKVFLTPPDEPYIFASFDWFLSERFDGLSDSQPWQDRFTGIKLRLDTVQRFYVPLDLSDAQRSAMEQGTATARYVLYQNKLYLIDPLL